MNPIPESIRPRLMAVERDGEFDRQEIEITHEEYAALHAGSIMNE